jgi:hypothetical protein
MEICPFRKIKQIEKLFNDNWKVNLTDPNQAKYYPYFEIKSSGLVFGGSSYSYCSFFGRVAFYKDSKTSDFVGKTFLKEYEEFGNYKG